jgi:hypothetical protein
VEGHRPSGWTLLDLQTRSLNSTDFRSLTEGRPEKLLMPTEHTADA